jgi:hypothetical protein
MIAIHVTDIVMPFEVCMKKYEIVFTILLITCILSSFLLTIVDTKTQFHLSLLFFFINILSIILMIFIYLKYIKNER